MQAFSLDEIKIHAICAQLSLTVLETQTLKSPDLTKNPKQGQYHLLSKNAAPRRNAPTVPSWSSTAFGREASLIFRTAFIVTSQS